jgi:hypothetical protein
VLPVLSLSLENVHAKCARFINFQSCARACARHIALTMKMRFDPN